MGSGEGCCVIAQHMSATIGPSDKQLGRLPTSKFFRLELLL